MESDFDSACAARNRAGTSRVCVLLALWLVITGRFQTKRKYKIMIDVIANLLTPAMLAMAPPSTPTIDFSYDWQQQRTEVTVNGEKLDSIAAGTMRGSQSFVNGSTTIDDWNQD
jgi:hypothetical protein